MIVLLRHRLLIVLVALVSLLFMQLAVAGYVCPAGMPGMKAEVTDVSAHAGMPCAGSMSETSKDDAQPALCHAHCHSDQQSADTYQLPDLPVMPAIAPVFGQQDGLLISRGRATPSALAPTHDRATLISAQLLLPHLAL